MAVAMADLGERRTARLNDARVRRLFLRYLFAHDNERQTQIIERDENTDKITRIRLHPDLEDRVVLAALAAAVQAMTRGERRAWLGVEFGIVEVLTTETVWHEKTKTYLRINRWQRRFFMPERVVDPRTQCSCMAAEEVRWYYDYASDASVAQMLSTARAKMRAALEDLRLE